MRTPEDQRDRFFNTLAHVRDAYGRARVATGTGLPLTFPDLHKISEGLFLSGWTYWEGFVREVFLLDLSIDPNGVLHQAVRSFRTKQAGRRLAAKLVDHPDTHRFVEWNDYASVRQRADDFLGGGNRWVQLPREQDLVYLRRIRNAIAHRSDRAWQSFRDLALNAPFSLQRNQLMGITPGRFLTSHTWNGNPVLLEAVNVLEDSSSALVP